MRSTCETEQHCERVESILLLLLFAKLANNCLTHMQHRMYSPHPPPSHFAAHTLQYMHTLDRINWSERIFSWRCLKIDSTPHHTTPYYIYACVCRHDSNIKMHLVGSVGGGAGDVCAKLEKAGLDADVFEKVFKWDKCFAITNANEHLWRV